LFTPTGLKNHLPKPIPLLACFYFFGQKERPAGEGRARKTSGQELYDIFWREELPGSPLRAENQAKFPPGGLRSLSAAFSRPQR
jgi:hypothetical protein